MKLGSELLSEKKLFPNDWILKGKYFDVGQDWEYPIPGFYIIGPKRKIRSFSDFTDDEAAEFMSILRRIRNGMRETLGIKDIFVYENEDTEPNFHVWLFPRYQWMEQFGKSIESIRPSMNYAKQKMADAATINQVKEYAKKMREYLKNH